MPMVVITHAVVITDFVAADGSNNIAGTADIADLAAIQSMLTSPSPEVLASMQETGVIPPITVYTEK